MSVFSQGLKTLFGIPKPLVKKIERFENAGGKMNDYVLRTAIDSEKPRLTTSQREALLKKYEGDEEIATAKEMYFDTAPPERKTRIAEGRREMFDGILIRREIEESVPYPPRERWERGKETVEEHSSRTMREFKENLSKANNFFSRPPPIDLDAVNAKLGRIKKKRQVQERKAALSEPVLDASKFRKIDTSKFKKVEKKGESTPPPEKAGVIDISKFKRVEDD